MRKLVVLSSGLCAGMLGTSWALVASAQGAASGSSASASEDSLQEIVVTAERKEESIQKTPMNVTVITGDTIQKEGLSNMQQILQDIPGVNVQGQMRGFTVTVRGLGTDLPPGSAQGSVAVDEDGVYDIRAESGTVGYYDLQRVEVLAGPQGTLYGVNSDGGVMNINTNNPALGKFDASGSASIGNYNFAQGQAAVNLPAGDTLAVRVAGTAISRDGFLDTGANDDFSQGARAKVLWQPSDKFSLLLGYEYAHIDGRGSGTIAPYANGDCHNAYNPYTGKVQYLSNCWSDVVGPAYGVTLGGYNAAGSEESDSLQTVDYHSSKVWAQVKWDLGFANLAFTPSYKADSAVDFACGMGACTVGGDPSNLEQNSAELKLTQASNSVIQWTLGVYHWGYLQLTTGSGPSGSVYQTSNAVFGDITYPVSDVFRVKAGVRESQDWKNETGAVSPLTFHHFDYRAGVEYDVAPQSMLYAVIATGYRPGGYNQVSPTVTTYKTEQVTDYEVGIKNRFFQDRLQLNADAFYYNFQNYQLNDFYTLGTLYCNNALNAAGPPSSTYENFQARNLGVDLSSAWVASDHDQVNASVTYLNNKFTSPGTVYYNPVNNCQAYLQGLDATEKDTVLAQTISNSVQPHSPTLSGSLSWEHRFALPDGGNIALKPDMTFTTGYYVNPLESDYSYQPTFEEYNLSGTYTAPSEKWTLAVWGRNLSNYAEKTNFAGGTAGIGQPRTYGVTITGHL